MLDWRTVGAASGLQLNKRAYKLKGYSDKITTSIRVSWDSRELTFDRPIRFNVDQGIYLTHRLVYDPDRGVIFPKMRPDLIHQFSNLKGVDIVSASNLGLIDAWRSTRPMKVCSVAWPANTRFADWDSPPEIMIQPQKTFKDGGKTLEAMQLYRAKRPESTSKDSCELSGPTDPATFEYDWDKVFRSK